MKTQTVDRSEWLARIVERDGVASANLEALRQITQARLHNAEHPGEEEQADRIFVNVRSWLVKAALRRHRKADHEAHAHFNNGLVLALDRTHRRDKRNRG